MSYYEKNRLLSKEKALIRYHSNRDVINEKQKLHFREVYFKFCSKYRENQRKILLPKNMVLNIIN